MSSFSNETSISSWLESMMEEEDDESGSGDRPRPQFGGDRRRRAPSTDSSPSPPPPGEEAPDDDGPGPSKWRRLGQTEVVDEPDGPIAFDASAVQAAVVDKGGAVTESAALEAAWACGKALAEIKRQREGKDKSPAGDNPTPPLVLLVVADTAPTDAVSDLARRLGRRLGREVRTAVRGAGEPPEDAAGLLLRGPPEECLAPDGTAVLVADRPVLPTSLRPRDVSHLVSLGAPRGVATGAFLDLWRGYAEALVEAQPDGDSPLRCSLLLPQSASLVAEVRTWAEGAGKGIVKTFPKSEPITTPAQLPWKRSDRERGFDRTTAADAAWHSNVDEFLSKVGNRDAKSRSDQWRRSPLERHQPNLTRDRLSERWHRSPGSRSPDHRQTHPRDRSASPIHNGRPEERRPHRTERSRRRGGRERSPAPPSRFSSPVSPRVGDDTSGQYDAPSSAWESQDALPRVASTSNWLSWPP